MQARCAAFDGTLQISARRAGDARPAQCARGTMVRARFAWDAMLADAACAERVRPAPRAFNS